MTELAALTADRALPDIVGRHVNETAFLAGQRMRAQAGPNYALRHLMRLDERLAAHLEGIRIAGPLGVRAAAAQIDESAGALFALAVTLLETSTDDLRSIIATRYEFAGQHWLGAEAAVLWVPWRTLLPRLREWTQFAGGPWQRLAIEACRSHRFDPAKQLLRWATEGQTDVRNDSLRAAGELGRIDLIPICLDVISEGDEQSKLVASISALLLGERGRAFGALLSHRISNGLHLQQAFRLVLQVLSVTEAHEILRDRGRDDATNGRSFLEGSGVIGDPAYVPWLLQQMVSDDTARVSGEAFTLITGADLALLDLERKPPENFESGPNDNPDDPNVDMDPDDGLPWPDVKKVEAWWRANEHRFQKGTRYFMGEPVTKEHCIHVLKTGYQRQRILAAQYLCLLEPGTPLFNTSAPAWRQQRLLAAM